MAQQLAAELNFSFQGIGEVVYGWLQEAREEAKVYREPTATSATILPGRLWHLEWRSLLRPGGGIPLPRRERNRKLLEDGSIMEAREERLLGIWCRKLREELLLINAPVLATLQGSLDPDRTALLLKRPVLG